MRASSWGGADLGSGDDPTTWGDYGRACAVDDYHGLVAFGPITDEAHALVLGDEPLASAYLAEHRCIVRWWCADTEHQLLAMVDDQLPHARWLGVMDWHVPPGGLVTIDAAYSVADYGPDGCIEGDFVRIDWPPGPCKVDTARLTNTEGSAVAIVHRLLPQR
ncbi:immunity 21 family protein [Glycomyces sp. TRM65418]|uniref:Imm21 family immunity protein n=1 Tax=Glycomyces sp. TRM65418 TaxID=2867006 RepID=UPI001D162041|nr:Imm21 family immunity protein [Glycomyces sp. TRM65418]MCC3761737.1 immunity 21 family protein [Glycomyces sp. TRM65418]